LTPAIRAADPQSEMIVFEDVGYRSNVLNGEFSLAGTKHQSPDLL